MLRAPRSRPPSRAPRIRDLPKTRRLQRSTPMVVPTWETPPGGGASRTNSGGRIRTCDLRVMSPTSYQTAPPRNRDEEVIRPANPAVNPFDGSLRYPPDMYFYRITSAHVATVLSTTFAVLTELLFAWS